MNAKNVAIFASGVAVGAIAMPVIFVTACVVLGNKYAEADIIASEIITEEEEK